MNYYIEGWKRAFDFSGRSRRLAYWIFVLVNTGIGIGLYMLDEAAGTIIEDIGFGIFYLAFVVIGVIPGLSVAVRRLHDTGKSAWFLLVPFIPIVGALWFLFIILSDSQPGTNKYGENPKGVTSAL